MLFMEDAQEDERKISRISWEKREIDETFASKILLTNLQILQRGRRGGIEQCQEALLVTF